MKKLISLLAFSGLAVFGADATAGKAVYDSKCKTCHGADGNGNPGMAYVLMVDIKPMSTPEIQAKSDADLKMVVTAGTGKMKPVTTVTGADLDNVVAFVRTFKK